MDFLHKDPQVKKLNEAKVEEEIRSNVISGLLLSSVLFLLAKQVFRDDNLKEIEDFLGNCGKMLSERYNVDNLKKEVEDLSTDKELDAETQGIMLELTKENSKQSQRIVEEVTEGIKSSLRKMIEEAQKGKGKGNGKGKE